MDVIMDGLLIAGAVFAGAYCWVLSRRVQALKSLDSGLGGAIVTLTRQIELARATLDEARGASRDTRQDLTQLVARSDAAAAQLRLLLASIETAGPPPAPARTATIPDPAPAPAPDLPPPPAAEDDLPARRRDARGPRLVALNDPDDAPEAEDGLEAAHERAPSIFAPQSRQAPEDTTVPKPHRTLSLDTLLRRRAAPEAPPVHSEADLIAALNALAAGGER